MSRFLSFLGRFSVAVLCTLLGGIAGLGIGLYRGIMAANALPPGPGTLGGEGAGFAPAVVIAIDLGLGSLIGAAAGVLVGIGLAVFWRGKDAQAG